MTSDSLSFSVGASIGIRFFKWNYTFLNQPFNTSLLLEYPSALWESYLANYQIHNNIGSHYSVRVSNKGTFVKPTRVFIFIEDIKNRKWFFFSPRKEHFNYRHTIKVMCQKKWSWRWDDTNEALQSRYLNCTLKSSKNTSVSINILWHILTFCNIDAIN